MSEPYDADLPLPIRSEAKLIHDEWMMVPTSRPVVPRSSPPATHATQHDSFTEGYGDAEGGGRTSTEDISSFSNLGKERKRKQPKDRIDPEKAIVPTEAMRTS